MSEKLRLTILGTGSSGGVPRIGNDWGACDPTNPKNRRSRCGAIVERWNDAQPNTCTRILLDTSADMREQLLAAGIGETDAVLISHDHADQVGGFDDLRVLAYRKMKRLPVYMDAATYESMSRRFAYCFHGEHGYPPIVELIEPFLEPGKQVSIEGAAGSIDILPIGQHHGQIDSLGFRFGPVAYCNDLKSFKEGALELLPDLDVLVIDALRYAEHPSHAHLEQSLTWIEELKPRRAFLTNLHVDMDYDTLCAELPAHVRPAYDGLTIEVAL